jgi:toxin ParE1/3/4
LAEVAFSRRAESDLKIIDDYTNQTWGEGQADLYLEQIHLCCMRLAETPAIGRLWSQQRPNLRRIEQGSHVIFYRQTHEGILIARILHRSMLPHKHTIEET